MRGTQKIDSQYLYFSDMLSEKNVDQINRTYIFYFNGYLLARYGYTHNLLERPISYILVSESMLGS